MLRYTFVLLAAFAFAAAAHASTPNAVNDCLEQTHGGDLNTAAIARGLGLPNLQLSEVRARLSTYNSAAGFQGLAGLGLTAAQETEIMRRVNLREAAIVGHPAGWPCSPFTNEARVVRWLRSTLVANGFRQGTVFYTTSPRQIQFRGVQDGQQVIGTAVSAGAKLVAVEVQTVPGPGQSAQSQTKTFAVTFTP